LIYFFVRGLNSQSYMDEIVSRAAIATR